MTTEPGPRERVVACRAYAHSGVWLLIFGRQDLDSEPTQHPLQRAEDIGDEAVPSRPGEVNIRPGGEAASDFAAPTRPGRT